MAAAIAAVVAGSREVTRAANLNRVTRWIRLGAEYLFASGLGQILGMVAGLIYVRVLPVDQYALYGLCLTTITFLNLASDVGLTQSVSYFWRKARTSGEWFGGYLQKIVEFRWWLFAGGGGFAALGFVVSTQHYGLGIGLLAALIFIILASVAAGLESTIMQALYRVESAYRRSYANELAGQVGRFAMALLVMTTLPATALFALLGSLVGGIATLIASAIGSPIRRHLSNRADTEAVPHGAGKAVARYVLPIAPNVVMFALQDTILYWAASLHGEKESIAQIFALSRINALLAVGTGFLIAVVMPRLANVHDERRFNRSYWALRAIFLIPTAAMVGVALVWPAPFLLIIGGHYSDLGPLLLLMILSFTFSIQTTVAGLANRLRGWVRLEPWIAAIQLSATILFVVFLPLNNAYDLAIAFLALNFSAMALHTVNSLTGHKRSPDLGSDDTNRFGI